MTARKSLYLILFSTSAASLVAAPAPVHVDETSLEFQTLADLDGDGRQDLVVVDKSTGQIRIAETDGSDNLIWRESPIDSGLRAVEGFSAGYLTDFSREALVLTSSLDNRIQIIDTPSAGTLIEPQLQMPGHIGPALITALQVPGGPVGDFSNDFEDLVYHAVLADPTNTNLVLGLRNRDGSLPFEEFGIAEQSGQASRPEAVILKSGSTPAYAVLRTALGGNRLELFDVENNPVALLDALDGLPAGCDFVAADFDGDGDAEFVFWVPESSTLFEVEWISGSGLGPLTSFVYPSPVTGLRLSYTTGAPELIVLREGGSAADRVSYSGSGTFTLEESFTPAPGEQFTGALSTSKVLHLTAGSSGSSARFYSYRYDGGSGTHAPQSSGSLPGLRTLGGASSVLLFDDNPLTRPEATLLSRLDAGAWTSTFSLGPGSASVESERFLDSASGLGDAQPVTVNNPPAATTDGLTSQVFPDLSMRFEEAPVGVVTARLSLSPPSGTYHEAVRPELSLNGSGILFYRFADTNWEKFDAGAPPVIIEDATFYAVAIDGSNFSNVVQASYSFPANPGEQDSNGDGVPDFVAKQYDLDPLAASWDSDSDGFTDLQEILGLTDPSDETDFPSRAHVSYDFPNTFDLEVGPGAPDPASTGFLRSVAATKKETRVQAHLPNGVKLADALTGTHSELHATAILEDLQSPDPDLFFIVSTELNFDVDIGDKFTANYGRQVAAIYPAPDLEYTPFVYQNFGDHGGFSDLAAEAVAWRVAALVHYIGLERPAFAYDPIDHRDTLALLLVERFLGSALADRNLTDRDTFSLTSFRPTETTLAPDAVPTPGLLQDRRIAHADLLELQLDSGGLGASYEIHAIIERIQDAVDHPKTSEQSALVELARRLYTLHATDADPGSLRQPLDALRLFLRSFSLDGSGFDKAALSTDLPPSLLTDAGAGALQILGLPEARSPMTVYVFNDGSVIDPLCPVWPEIFFTSGTFDPASPFYTGNSWSFVDDAGQVLPFGRGFPLTEGSVFAVRGFEIENVACGDRTLEVIPQPELAYLANSSTVDLDGNLVPDALEALAPNVDFNPLGDSDSDGYSDLQEMLQGSDPHLAGSIPMDGMAPAEVANLSPPALEIEVGISSAEIRFSFPPEFADYIAFDLYESDDLSVFSSSGMSAEHIGGGDFFLPVFLGETQQFYRLRMRLK